MTRRTHISEKGIGTPAFIGTVLGLGILIIGAAVLIGRSDSGQINVGAAVESSNQANPGNAQVAPVREAFKNLPNGGLVPTGGSEPQAAPAPVPTAEDTPTAPEEAATTTTEGGEDATEN